MRTNEENVAERVCRVSFGLYEIDVTPMTMSEWLAARGVVGDLIAALDRDLTWAELLHLFAERGQSVISAIAIAARLPHEQVGALPVADVIELLYGLIAINSSVAFEQRINDVETCELS